MLASTNHTITQKQSLSNLKFLTAIFGEYALAAHVTGFIESPSDLPKLGLNHYWGGNAWYKRPLENPDFNNFLTISTFHAADDGTHRRRKDLFAAGFAMMIDDVGTGTGSKIDPFMLGSLMVEYRPSCIIETSPDNYQYWYFYDEPVMDRGKIEALLKGFVAKGLVDGGADPGMLGVTRYGRLPVGSNTKAVYGEPFRHVVIEWDPDRRYSIDTLAANFDIKLQDYYPDTIEDFGTAVSPEDDPVYQSLKRLGMIKGVNRSGIYDVICPWVSQHTELLDNGSAYLAPMGYRCHHGHCESKTGRDLMGYLHGKDPIYKAHCAALLPFEPVSDPTPSIQGVSPVASHLEALAPLGEMITEFDIQFNAMLQLLDPNNPLSAEGIYRLVAQHYTKFNPLEINLYTNLIKGKMNCTLKVARDQMKHVRAELLREHRKNGVLDEPAWKDLEGDKIIGTLDNFRAVCEFHGITLRFNQMNHSIDCDIPGEDFSKDDIDNLNLTHMRDAISRYGMNHMRTGEWMNSVAFENEFHPFRDYLDKISGLKIDPTCPTFAKLFSTLDINVFGDESEVFLRRWLISIVAMVRGHAGAGAKGCLTLSGKQGCGKTSWFRNLFEEGMFQEGMVLDPHNKDSIIQATNALVTEFGELDSTFKRDIPAIKAFMTNQFDKVRHPYAAKVSSTPRRTVFCASVNAHDFLVDPTGNSRFWAVSVNKCNFLEVENMRASGEIDMLWAEIQSMYYAAMDGVSEFRWWIGIEDGDLLDRVSEEFVKHTAGETMLRECFDMDGPLIEVVSTQEIMTTCGLMTSDHNYGVRKNELMSAIRRITGQQRQSSHRVGGVVEKGYKMPRRLGAGGKARLTAVSMPFEASDFPWL